MDTTEVEAVNKLRKSLGMPPLPLPSQSDKNPKHPDATKDDELSERNAVESAEANWKKYEEAQAAARASSQRSKTLDRLRKLQARNRKLEGPTLGDPDDKTDTKSWLKGQKRRMEQLQRSWQEQEEEEQRKKARILAHGTNGLAGVKIGHDAKDFAFGIDQILTLPDREIDVDDEEEDVLESADLRANERLKEKLQSRAKKTAYDPLDDDGTTEKSILSQYDEEIEGKKKNQRQFTLDSKGGYQRSAKKTSQAEHKPGFRLYEDMFADNQQPPQSDFKESKEKRKKAKAAELDENGRPVFKKRDKKQNKRQTAQVNDSSVDEIGDGAGSIAEPMDVEANPTMNNAGPAGETRESEAGTSAPRRSQHRRRTSLDELVPRDRQDRRHQPTSSHDPSSTRAEKVLRRVKEASTTVADDSGTVMNSVSMTNFLNHHLDPKAYHQYLAELDEQERLASAAKDEVGSSKAGIAAEAGRDVQMEVDEDDYDQKLPEGLSPEVLGPGATTANADNENSFSSIGDTIASLRKRGEIAGIDNESARKTAEHEKMLSFQRQTRKRLEREAQAQKAKDRASGRHAGMTNAQRDEAARVENERREQRTALALAEGFDERYQPTFTLEYADANGRLMDEKEAFRHMSHQFHGKAPGNNKQAKYAKKLEKQKESIAHQVFSIDRQAKSEQHRQEKGQAGYRLG